MFQACVSVSACIFYVFMNIYRVCVYKWAYCWVKKKKNLTTYLPYFSVARYGNTIFFFGLSVPILHYDHSVAPLNWFKLLSV